MSKATSVMVFDKQNKQDEYRYIARDLKGKLVIGWIVVEQPWYSSKSDWTYWMYSNKYGGGGICGGCTDLGLERVQVRPETIKPFNQIEHIKYDLEHDFDVKLEDKFQGNTLAIIHREDEIPYELWD